MDDRLQKTLPILRRVVIGLVLLPPLVALPYSGPVKKTQVKKPVAAAKPTKQKKITPRSQSSQDSKTNF